MASLVTETSGSNNVRSAMVFKDDEGYIVEVYEHGEPVRRIDVRQHSIHYANDTAENWCSCIIKE